MELGGQIIAIGGGGFGRNPNHLKIEKYILAQSKKKCPNICFIPTASAENQEYIKNYNVAFHQLNCSTTVLSLFSRTPDLPKLILNQDVIYVGGGNTKSMLAVWKEWNLDKLLVQAYKNGAILCGVSAGAICWFNKGITDSWENELKVIDCMGILNQNGCPHYNGEKDRRPSVMNFIKKEIINSCICIDDGAAVHYIDGAFQKVVSFDGGSAYNASIINGRYNEQKLMEIHL